MDSNNSRKALRSVSLFESLSEEELSGLVPNFELKEFEKHERIIVESESSPELYVILSGFVNIFRGEKKDEVFLTLLERGDYFGEAALFNDVKRTANAMAAEKTSLLVINRNSFKKYLEDYPFAANRILYEMLKQIFERLAQTSAELQFERKDALVKDAFDKMLL